MLSMYTFKTNAQDGSLDLTFGNNGKVVTSYGTFIRSIKIQPNGKIIAVGDYTPSFASLMIARYNSDGSLDNSFNGNGLFSLYNGVNPSAAYGVALQTNNKIVVAGNYKNTTYSELAVFRLHSNGTLDSSFDGDGMTLLSVIPGLHCRAHAVAIQSNGKIVTAGYSKTLQDDLALTICRFNTDGSLDLSFNNSGFVLNDISNGDDQAYAIKIQDDGKLVVCGSSDSNGQKKMLVIRYNYDGSLDNSFGTNGVVLTAIGSNNLEARALDIQTDGKILAAGTASTPYPNFAIVRYNIDGNLDTSFGLDGISITSPESGSYGKVHSIFCQTDGKILAGGGISDFRLGKFNSDGSLDTSFGTAGFVTTNIYSMITDDMALCMDIQSDNKVILGGGSVIGLNGDHQFSMARYNNSIGISDIFEPSELVNDFQIFPNPLTEKSLLASNFPLENTTVKLYNSLGMKVTEKNNLSGYSILLDKEDLKSGVYFITIERGNNELLRSKLVVSY